MKKIIVCILCAVLIASCAPPHHGQPATPPTPTGAPAPPPPPPTQ